MHNNNGKIIHAVLSGSLSIIIGVVGDAYTSNQPKASAFVAVPPPIINEK